MALNPKLLEIIICPKCKGNLLYQMSLNQLLCNNCKLCYRVENDIPIMIIEEAKILEG